MIARVLRAPWFWFLLTALVWVGVFVTLAYGDVKKHDDAVDVWPGRGRIGPERCGTADTRQGGHDDGTWAYFRDAQPTCPMVCDGTPSTNGTGPGAWCVHEAGQWDCCLGAAATCTPLSCPGGVAVADDCTISCLATTTTVTTTTTTTATTLPMPECENVGDPCGSCTDPPGICLSRCDGITCAFICVQIVSAPCGSMDCMMAGPLAICVDATPFGCVDGVCDENTECGFPCFGPTASTTTTTAAPTTTIVTTTTTTTTVVTTTDTTPTTTSTTVTTTTTTTTTTVTTTTTSTTTTTTIVDSVTFLWLPTVPQATGNVPVTGGDVLDCTAWTPTLGIAHATSLSFDIACPGPDVNFSISIYSADGSTRITTTGQTLCTYNGNYQINTGDFSLDAGTKYQVCGCGATTSVNFLSPNAGPSSAVSVLAQAISGGELRTTGANPCITGAPPLTTGALTAVQHNVMPIVLIGTATP